MTAVLTYLQFHALFVVPVLAGLALTADVRLGSARAVASGTALLAALALVYTTPWDNALIERGVWWYGEGTVLVRFWAAPLGEYLFFLLQPAVIGMWAARFPVDTTRSLATPLRTRLVGVVAATLVGGTGVALLGDESGLYLGSLLVWSAPILAVQWAFGWRFLVAERRTVAVATVFPTLYLWGIDRVALALDLWSLSNRHTTGFDVPLLGLPIEEAAFFFLTTLFVVQGLVLYAWLLDRWG